MDEYVKAQEQQDGQKGNGTGFVVLRPAHVCNAFYIVLWRLIMIVSYAILRYYCRGRWLTDCMCMGEVKTRLPTPRPSAQTASRTPL